MTRNLSTGNFFAQEKAIDEFRIYHNLYELLSPALK